MKNKYHYNTLTLLATSRYTVNVAQGMDANSMDVTTTSVFLLEGGRYKMVIEVLTPNPTQSFTTSIVTGVYTDAPELLPSDLSNASVGFSILLERLAKSAYRNARRNHKGTPDEVIKFASASLCANLRKADLSMSRLQKETDRALGRLIGGNTYAVQAGDK